MSLVRGILSAGAQREDAAISGNMLSFCPPGHPPPPVVSICSNQTFCHANQWLVAALWSAALNSFSLIN